MKDEFDTTHSGTPEASLSKRGARRVIQRAFVLVARDKTFRQSMRSVELNTYWSVEEWALEWTVHIVQGRLEFYRGHTGRAQTSLNWKTGEDFMNHVESGKTPMDGFQLECQPAEKDIAELLLARFCSTLKSVLENPVDDAGVRLG